MQRTENPESVFKANHDRGAGSIQEGFGNSEVPLF